MIRRNCRASTIFPVDKFKIKNIKLRLTRAKGGDGNEI